MSTARLVALCAMAVVVSGELPLFNHTYNMQQSTIAMPCNYTGNAGLGEVCVVGP